MRTTTGHRDKRHDSKAEQLQERLQVAEETLSAIRQGKVDALVVAGTGGDQVFSLKGAETPYRLLIEAMNEGALTALPDGTILYCNNRFAEMVRTPARQIIGSLLHEFVPAKEQTALAKALKSLSRKGRKAEFNLCARENPRERLPVQFSFRSLEIEELRTVCVVATDLTERKRLERDLQRQNEELEQRVAARTEELTAVNEALMLAHQKLNLQATGLQEEVANRTMELERSIRSLEEFCYTIAHDLRAPLRTMHGFSAALVNDFAPQLGDRGQDYANRILNSAARMDTLIRDLLAYGRLNSSDIPVGKLDPGRLLEQWLERNVQNELNVQIQKPLPLVLANATALAQVMHNLLDNAIKFVSAGITPEIRIFSTEKDGWVRLSVSDNGIGIDPQYRERIFNVFERLSPTRYPGTGIGLAIVKKGVERMGGRVGVESETGKGSCFWIELRKAE